MRRAAKVDDNHREIVQFFRSIPSCAVLDLARVGNGCPDILVFYREYYLVEIKDGSKPPSRRKLTPDQQQFHARWPDKIHVIKSVDEAAQLLGV